MQPIRVAIRASDPGTLAELERELAALRGQEPAGAELLDDPTPRPRSVDPLLATLAFALVTGMASGAGKKLGEALMTWLIDRIRAVVKRRKTSVTLTVAGVALTVDEHSDPDRLAAAIVDSLGARP
jgi:hypothetical protein